MQKECEGCFILTLINQLKNDLEIEFSNHIEYLDIIIKEKYELYPEVSYPCIYIEEIENVDNERYHDETEQVSSLGYVFTINAEQSETLTAVQNVRNIANIIDTYFKGERYKSLRRLGGLVIKPLPGDDTVMTGYLTYNCDVEIKTNTIYRRK